MGVNIRDATASDAPAIAELAAVAVRDTYAPIAQPAVYETVIAQTCTTDSMAVAIERALDDANGHFLVAVDDSTGAIECFLDFGTDDDGILELRRLYTRVDLRSRGVGRRMLAELEDRLAYGTRYRAIVHARNERGLAFWNRHGFVIEGQLDTRDHFAAHRGLEFSQTSELEPSLILMRTLAGSASGR